MPKGHAKAPSQRQLRVGEELRHVIAGLLDRGEVHDPDVQGTPVTVTEVRASPDLKNASVYIMPLGGDAETMQRVLKGLNRARPFLRRLLAEKVRLRHTPRLDFKGDTTFDNAGHIDSLLRDPMVARDLAVDDVADRESKDGA